MRPAPLHLAVLAACFLLTASGCCSADRSLFPPQVAAPGQPVHVVYVTSNHMHSGLILPDAGLPHLLDQTLVPWRNELKRLGQPAPTWHEFGWGDDAYYRTPTGEETSGLTLQAMLWPTRSVNHLFALAEPPEAFFDGWDLALFRIELTQAGYQRLAEHVASYFASDDAGQSGLDWIGTGVYGASSGFATGHPKRRYTLLHNCNHMVADALRAAGLPISPIYAIHASNIEYQLDRAARNHPAITRVQSRHAAE